MIPTRPEIITSFIAIVKIDNLDVLAARDWRDSLHGVDIRSLSRWRSRAEAELGDDGGLRLRKTTVFAISTAK
jgi:hypothetical protein